MTALIRDFVETDRLPLRQLYLLTRQSTFNWIASSQFQLHDFDTATVAEHILVAELHGQPVGFASISVADNFIHNLFVHPDYQRQGIGQALLAACTPYFNDAATLKCLQANRQALLFYFAFGWQILELGEAADGPYYVLKHQPMPHPGWHQTF